MSTRAKSHRRSITLPDEHDRILGELAETYFGGNVSAAVRRLLETNSVTKSQFALARRRSPATR